MKKIIFSSVIFSTVCTLTHAQLALGFKGGLANPSQNLYNAGWLAGSSYDFEMMYGSGSPKRLFRLEAGFGYSTYGGGKVNSVIQVGDGISTYDADFTLRNRMNAFDLRGRLIMGLRNLKFFGETSVFLSRRMNSRESFEMLDLIPYAEQSDSYLVSSVNSPGYSLKFGLQYYTSPNFRFDLSVGKQFGGSSSFADISSFENTGCCISYDESNIAASDLMTYQAGFTILLGKKDNSKHSATVNATNSGEDKRSYLGYLESGDRPTTISRMPNSVAITTTPEYSYGTPGVEPTEYKGPATIDMNSSESNDRDDCFLNSNNQTNLFRNVFTGSSSSSSFSNTTTRPRSSTTSSQPARKFSPVRCK